MGNDIQSNVTNESDAPKDSSQRAQENTRLDDLCEIKDRLYSTRTSDIFHAIDKSSGENRFVCLLKSPLAVGSEAAERFIKRVSAFSAVESLLPRLHHFGVDKTNRAYIVTDFVRGRNPIHAHLSADEAIRAYEKLLRAVAGLHRQNVVLGDIGEESFLLDTEDNIFPIGLAGSFEIESVGTTQLPAAHTLHYLSPEQRVGSGLETASDVYALGIYGYRLFTGRYPRAEKHMTLVGEDVVAMVPPPSGVVHELPSWLDDVVGKAVEPRIQDRFRDAEHLHRCYQEAFHTGVSPAGPSRWSKKTLMVRPTMMGVMREQLAEGEPSKPVSYDGRPGNKTDEFHHDRSGFGKGLMVVSLGLLLGVLVAGIAYVLLQDNVKSAGELESEIAIHDDYAPPELRRSMHDVVAPGVSPLQRKEALQRIADNDDPVADTIILRVAKSAPTPELREAAQQFVVERIKRKGFERSAKVIARWFESSVKLRRDPTQSEGYSQLLRACDRSLPLEARRFALSKAYASEPMIALELAAALALDESDPNSFTPVLRQFVVSELGGNVNLEDKSALALILGHKVLALTFDEEISGQLAKLPAQDLAWALLRLSESESSLLYSVAEETLRRKVVPPFQAVFLKVLSEADRLTIPTNVRRALVRGARGEIGESDIVAFGRWLSLQAEPALLAVCAIAGKDTTAVSAFDTLAARELEAEPARSLVRWIKSSYWEHREKLVKAVGILGLSDTATEDQIEYAFDVLMPFASGGTLLRVVTNSKNDMLIARALDRLGEATPSDELLPLLNHENRSVRIAAIRGLKGRNELGVLQSIIKAYEKEKDPEVQEIYKEIHWVVKDREKVKEN